MLSDPMVITIGAIATNFARVSSSSKRAANGLVDQSVYRTSDGTLSLTVSEFFRTTSVLDDKPYTEFQVMLNRRDNTKSDKPISSVGISYRVTDGYVPDFTDLFTGLSNFLSNSIRDRIVGGEN